MDWTNWIMLGAGLAAGAIGGWIAARPSLHKISSLTGEKLDIADSATSGSTALPHSAPPSTKGTQISEMQVSEMQALADELHRTRLAYHMAKELGQLQAGFWPALPTNCDRPLTALLVCIN
ncbi:hypothetical protein [Egbenema bharatensis]|uniref:hypothetical protein n=1 Tax=Egbenema bharatensis TaxID=3463334 RepID=UPI003A845E32